MHGSGSCHPVFSRIVHEHIREPHAAAPKQQVWHLVDTRPAAVENLQPSRIMHAQLCYMGDYHMHYPRQTQFRCTSVSSSSLCVSSHSAMRTLASICVETKSGCTPSCMQCRTTRCVHHAQRCWHCFSLHGAHAANLVWALPLVKQIGLWRHKQSCGSGRDSSHQQRTGCVCSLQLSIITLAICAAVAREAS